MVWLSRTPEALLTLYARKTFDDRREQRGPANYVKFKDLNKSFILKPGSPFYNVKLSIQLTITEAAVCKQ